MQSTFPRSFLPSLQVGFSVTLEHRYGHCDLVEMLNKFGFWRPIITEEMLHQYKVLMQLVTLREHSSSAWQKISITQLNLWMDMNAVHVMGQMMTFTPAISTSRIIPRSTVNMEDVKEIWHAKLIIQIYPKYILGPIEHIIHMYVYYIHVYQKACLIFAFNISITKLG